MLMSDDFTGEPAAKQARISSIFKQTKMGKFRKITKQIYLRDDIGCGVQGKITLETSGEDVKLHSKRVEKMLNYTRKDGRRC
jgi:hypothetical protein